MVMVRAGAVLCVAVALVGCQGVEGAPEAETASTQQGLIIPISTIPAHSTSFTDMGAWSGGTLIPSTARSAITIYFPSASSTDRFYAVGWDVASRQFLFAMTGSVSHGDVQRLNLQLNTDGDAIRFGADVSVGGTGTVVGQKTPGAPPSPGPTNPDMVGYSWNKAQAVYDASNGYFGN